MNILLNTLVALAGIVAFIRVLVLLSDPTIPRFFIALGMVALALGLTYTASLSATGSHGPEKAQKLVIVLKTDSCSSRE